MWLGQLSINTVSFFTATVVDDPNTSNRTHYSTYFFTTVKDLKLRLLEIVKCNPWLIGKCKTLDESDEFCLHYVDTSKVTETEVISAADIDKIFNVIDDDTFSSTLSYEDMSYAFKNFAVKPGLEIINSDNNVFQISIINCSNTEFALIMSLSHMIADGHNYYQIWNMLSPLSKYPVIALRFDRKFDVHSDAFYGTRVIDDGIWLTHRWEISDLLKAESNNRSKQHNVHTINTSKLHQHTSKIYKVNMSRIEEIKRSHIPSVEVPYLTTHDILVPILAKWKNAQYPNIIANFRKKIVSTTLAVHDADLLVGNYIAAIQLEPWEFETPQQLRRRVLADFYRDPNQRLPDASKCNKSLNDILLTTAWHNFYDGDFMIDGYKMSAHYPHLDTSYLHDSSLVIIFRMGGNQGDIGVMCCDNSETRTTAVNGGVSGDLRDFFEEFR